MFASFKRAAAVAVFTAAVSLLAAKGIDLSHRNVAFVVNDTSVLSGTLESRFIPGGKSLLLKPQLSSASAELSHALFVPGVVETTVTLNGELLYLLPLERVDGFVYSLDPRHLVAGENQVRIDRAAPGSWTGLAMFSLRDAYEEVHFADAFRDPVTAMELATREASVSNLQTNYDALWYDCIWIPDMNVSYMHAGSQVIMGAKSLVNGLQQIEIDFDMNPAGNGGSPMDLDYVDSGNGTPGLSWSYTHHSLTPRLLVTLPAPLNAGEEFQIRIGYHGTPNNNPDKKIFGQSALQARTQPNNSRPVVYSVSQPYGGRRWWPSKDHPSDKPTTTIQRIIVPKPAGYTLTAVSNGVLDPVIDHGTTREFTWRNNHPIATYLMSMAISDYLYRGDTYTSRDGQTQMPVGSYIYPQHEGFEGNGYLGTIQVMNFFADTFGEYPFLDQKYVTAAWNIGWAIEHQTATSTSAGRSDGLADGLTRRNVHELAHQWFGNKLTTANWDHLWLNEGFATYAEALFFGHLSGQWRYHDVMNGLSPSSSTPVIGPSTDNFAGSVAYDRGAWILHMLRYQLGDTAFFKLLKDYAAHSNTSVLSQPGDGADLDFQTVVEQSAGLASGSMYQFFRQWLYSPDTSYDDRPRFSFSAGYDIDTSSVLVRLKQTQTPSQPFQMAVPIGLIAADNSTTVIRVEATASQVSIPLGSFVPVASVLDPDNWILNRQSISIHTSSLVPAVVGSPYIQPLQASASASWQKIGGAGWLSISSSGVISGTPPAPGIYSITVRAAASSQFIDATLDVVATSGTPPPSVVINELLYRNQDGDDNAEYVELKNTSIAPVDISSWQLAAVSGSSGEPTVIVVFPSGTILQPADYYVIGNAASINGVYGGSVDLNTGWNEALTDARGAIVLKTELGVRVDSLAYGSDGGYGAGSHTSLAIAEGGTGLAISSDITDTAGNAVLGRLPDGHDTNSNLRDFAIIPPSPGEPNTSGVTLPFFDDFNNGARPEWRAAFDDPVRTAMPGQAGKVLNPAPAPAGGNVLEVVDRTGGGDVVFLPGAFDKLNVEGYIHLPITGTATSWSTGIGIGTRVESAWFSSASGYGLENGFYLEYQNGPDVDLKGGRVPNSHGLVRLFAADSTGCPGVGLSAFSATTLGTPRGPSAGQWNHFRLFMDIPANRLYADINGQEIYNGPLPASGFYTPGGVTFGFRENHSDGPSATAREGTWVDNITVNTNTGLDSHVQDYYLY